jgi:hemin uptake protein HemP
MAGGGRPDEAGTGVTRVKDVKSQGEDGSANAPMQRNSIDSTTLLEGNNEIAIVHDGQVYRLRLTSTGKLILTK